MLPLLLSFVLPPPPRVASPPFMLAIVCLFLVGELI
jgi:hypothetical protein